MLTSELHYELPPSAIAQRPVEPRDSARLLVDLGDRRDPQHRTVADLDQLLDPGDVLVVNDTRVIPARLALRKETGGAVEVLLLERRPAGEWEALVKPGRRVPPGTRLRAAAGDGASEFEVEVGEPLAEDGRRLVTLHHGPSTEDLDWLHRLGKVPLPPYIREELADPERYQTVYANHPGSVAAPTAGLHLTDALLDRCRDRGVTVARIELVVGLGTFRPVTSERVEDHPMHAEHYRIPADVEALLVERSARRPPRGRVVAVGTTVVRALESWAISGKVEGDTDLFIHGDHQFAVVERLMTNFHVPQSSLLALVQALIGPRWRDLYRIALDEGYRFLSFGDAMLLDPRNAAGTSPLAAPAEPEGTR